MNDCAPVIDRICGARECAGGKEPDWEMLEDKLGREPDWHDACLACDGQFDTGMDMIADLKADR